MTKSKTVIDSATGVVLEEVVPPFNFWSGRDTSAFALTFDGEEGRSRTSQEFAEDADVNVIMARYIKTGTIPVYLDQQALVGDLHEWSYHDMQNAIAEANSAFAALPAAVRARFDNDPAKFVEFASDDKNVTELRELGMLSPEAIERLDAAEAAKAAEAAVQASPAAKPVEPPTQ